MKTFVVILALLAPLTLAPLPAQATALSLTGQAKEFATCAGRLSALMEHQWMFDGAASEQTKVRRKAFVDLIDAIFPDLKAQGIDGPQVLHWRIEAKMAQAALLQRASFSQSEREKRQAHIVSARLLSRCTAQLLG